MAIDTTRALIAQITNASQVGENTATRVGTTMDAMLDDVKDNADDIADLQTDVSTAEANITNLQGRMVTAENTNAVQNVNIQGLQHALQNVQQVTINGNVTNNPDQIFLTSENNLITPKERTTSDSAKGHYIMRQGEFAAKLKANYIHELPFDVDLNGTSVTIPSGAVLFMNGGKIMNGTLVGTDTRIIDNTALDCTLGGTFIADEGIINQTNFANVVAHIQAPIFRVVEDVNVASGFDTEIVSNTTIDCCGHSVNIPSFLIDTKGCDLTFENATVNTTQTRVYGSDASPVHLVDSVGGAKLVVKNISFTALVGQVNIRNYKHIRVENCSLVGATQTALSRTGGIMGQFNDKVEIIGNSFEYCKKAYTNLSGTSADEVSMIAYNNIRNCDGGLIAAGGIVCNYKVIGNKIIDTGSTTDATYSSINIHGMDGNITVADNTIINSGGDSIDLDSSDSGAPDPNTNPYVVCSNNYVNCSTEQNVSFHMIPNVIFEGNAIYGLLKLGHTDCANIVIKGNTLVGTQFLDSAYRNAGTYNVVFTDNYIDCTNAMHAVWLNVDNVAVTMEVMRNSRKNSSGTKYNYLIYYASSVRTCAMNTDWTKHDKHLVKSEPMNLNRFAIKGLAYAKVSFDLSEAINQSAYTFIANIWVIRDYRQYAVTIMRNQNTAPRAQTIYAPGGQPIPTLWYEYNSTTLVLDVYFVVGGVSYIVGDVFLANPSTSKIFDVTITPASTTQATAESKTRLRTATYIEAHDASEMSNLSNNAISFSNAEGVLCKMGGVVSNYLGIKAGQLIGTTAERPSGMVAGFQYFDTTLGIPIWYDGSNWVKADGTNA